MSKKIKIFLMGFLVMVLAAAIVLPGLAQAPAGQSVNSLQATATQPETTTVTRKITVMGIGQVIAKPDMAVVSMGVTTTAEKAADALSQNNEAIQKLIDTLKAGGVAADDIQTVQFSLYPHYGEKPTTDTSVNPITGYDVTNVVEVKVRNLDKLGSLLDIVVGVGGNVIQGVTLQISDTSALLDQAREAAMQDARSKAEKLAGLADAQLGAVLEVIELDNTPGVIVQPSSAALQSMAVPIEAGTQTVQLQLTVVWELK